LLADVACQKRYRYYAICNPLHARHVRTITRALVLVAIIWLTSLLLLSPQLVIQRLEPILVLQPDQEPWIRQAQVSTTCRPIGSANRVLVNWKVTAAATTTIIIKKAIKKQKNNTYSNVAVVVIVSVYVYSSVRSISQIVVWLSPTRRSSTSCSI